MSPEKRFPISLLGLLVAVITVLAGLDFAQAAELPPPFTTNAVGEVQFAYTNTMDQSMQMAAAYLPTNQAGKPRPLLVLAHYWGGDRFTARSSGYYPECEKRGWILLCPQLHGHRTGNATALASLESQHDVIDAIAFLAQRLPVDRSRIYIVGRSMGGMLTQVMAAKYPDLFAAAVAGQGVSDVKSWIEVAPQFKPGVEAECGVFGAETSFDYARRSSINFARNIRYVPLILWQSVNDTWVPPEQSEALDRAIREFYPRQSPIVWRHGASHCEQNFPPEWECDQLQYYCNVSEAGMGLDTRFYPELNLVTDEDKAFFWLDLTRGAADQFGRIRAAIRGNILELQAENLSAVGVNLSKLAAGVALSRCVVKSNRPVRVRILKADKILAEQTIEKAGQIELAGGKP